MLIIAILNPFLFLYTMGYNRWWIGQCFSFNTQVILQSMLLLILSDTFLKFVSFSTKCAAAYKSSWISCSVFFRLHGKRDYLARVLAPEHRYFMINFNIVLKRRPAALSIVDFEQEKVVIDDRSLQNDKEKLLCFVLKTGPSHADIVIIFLLVLACN